MTDLSRDNQTRRKSSPALKPDGTLPYTIQNCDTLAGIAAQFNTTTSVIKKLNRLMSDLVFPGQVLFVPDNDYIPSASSPTSPSFMEASHIFSAGSPSQNRLSGTRNIGGELKVNKLLGHVERLHSTEMEEQVTLPRPLSTEEVKKLIEECDERFIKLNVLRIVRTEANPLTGVMLVTPDCVMFDPGPENILSDGSSPERYAVTLPMKCVMSVAVYHDLTEQQLKQAAKAESENIASEKLSSEVNTTDSGNNQKQHTEGCDTQDQASGWSTCDKPTEELTSTNAVGSSDAADQATEQRPNAAEILQIDDDAVEDTSVTQTTQKPLQKFDAIADPTGASDPLRIYLCIKGFSAGVPSHVEKLTKADKYWFSVPFNKVDQLFAFFVQWSPNLTDDSQFADEQGFVVVSNSEDNLFNIDDLPPRQSRLCRSTSFSKDWEIVNVLQLQQRVIDAEIENLPLPTLSHSSDILEESHLRVFMNHLPARAEGGSWHLVYSTNKHGFSLLTLYRLMTSVDSPVLLVIKDNNGQVFGTMQSCPMKRSDLFYGTGESYLFTFNPDFKKFRWTGANNFFTKGSHESLCFGASKGNNGLWLDGDLYHGRTQHCQTYNNDILSSAEDFTIKYLEAWCFI